MIFQKWCPQLTRWNPVALVKAKRIRRRHTVHRHFLSQTGVDVDRTEERNRLQQQQQQQQQHYYHSFNQFKPG